MIKMFDLLRQLTCDKRAVTSLEYALIGGVIAVVMVVGAASLGTNLSTGFVLVAGRV
jgi:Flp pilus assembly pilin Flp